MCPDPDAICIDLPAAVYALVLVASLGLLLWCLMGDVK